MWFKKAKSQKEKKGRDTLAFFDASLWQAVSDEAFRDDLVDLADIAERVQVGVQATLSKHSIKYAPKKGLSASRLGWAIYMRDESLVRRALALGAKPTERFTLTPDTISLFGEQAVHPLALTCELHEPVFLSILLEHGANPNTRIRPQMPLITRCVQLGDPHLISILMSDASLCLHVDHEHDPIAEAIQLNRLELLLPYLNDARWPWEQGVVHIDTGEHYTSYVELAMSYGNIGCARALKAYQPHACENMALIKLEADDSDFELIRSIKTLLATQQWIEKPVEHIDLILKYRCYDIFEKLLNTGELGPDSHADRIYLRRLICESAPAKTIFCLLKNRPLLIEQIIDNETSGAEYLCANYRFDMVKQFAQYAQEMKRPDLLYLGFKGALRAVLHDKPAPYHLRLDSLFQLIQAGQVFSKPQTIYLMMLRCLYETSIPLASPIMKSLTLLYEQLHEALTMAGQQVYSPENEKILLEKMAMHTGHDSLPLSFFEKCLDRSKGILKKEDLIYMMEGTFQGGSLPRFEALTRRLNKMKVTDEDVARLQASWSHYGSPHRRKIPHILHIFNRKIEKDATEEQVVDPNLNTLRLEI